MNTMRVLIVSSLAVTTAPTAWAAPTCKSVHYSEAVVDALPDVRDLCLRVEERDGKEFAVVQAEVSRVHNKNALEVRFKRPDGSKSPSRYFETAPDRRVLVEGKPTRVQDLVVGQELTAYIHVQKPMIATEPVTKGDPLEPVPLETEPPRQP
jgi:hypothetical protein